MCFAPQRRALFRHLTFQKWSENGVLCTFWLRNVLGATTACNFSSLIWPAGSAPAALASLLFDPPEPQFIRKTQCFATFLPLHLLSSDFFSSTLLSSNLSLLSALPYSAFHLSILSEVWLLNFLRRWIKFDTIAKTPRKNGTYKNFGKPNKTKQKISETLGWDPAPKSLDSFLMFFGFLEVLD